MKSEKDIAWQCLPKIMQDRIISVYFCKKDCPDSEFNKGYLKALVGIFDEHNITSHVEPEEMLFVEKSKVVELYNRVSTDDYIVTSSGQKLQLSRGIRFALRTLFKDKCLPDKEKQAKPTMKFKVGDKVRVIDYDRSMGSLFYIQGKICVISGITSANMYSLELINDFDKNIKVNEYDTAEEFLKSIQWDESFLELYTEDTNMKEFRKGDKVKIVNVANPEVCGKVGVIKEIPTKDEPQYEVSFDTGWTLLDSNQMEHYNEPEPKIELNLGALLMDCVGDTFFHPHYGDVTLAEVTENYIELNLNDGGTINTPARDCLYSTGMAFLYPDAESLKKYPFDGLVAWQEWSESRKPKRWKPNDGETFWFINSFLNVASAIYDKENFDSYTIVEQTDNCFQSYELCQQAAEEVRKTLESFHNRKEGEQ